MTVQIRRRTFLGGGLAASFALATGCSTKVPTAASSPATVASLVSTSPFYVAHRGGGDNWPEMTAYAYRQASLLPGLAAIEVSVQLSADGVLVCSHDASTARVTGVALDIARTTWADLAPLKVTSAFTNDPTQPAQPFSRFDDVVAQHIDRLVMFVEPKSAAALAPLMATMAALRQPERVVWKQPVNQPSFAEAKQHGFATWGYVLDEPSHRNRLAELAASSSIDMLGVATNAPEELATAVVTAARANGKKTIMWPIRSADDRARALRLGCVGMMTSDIVDVPGEPL